MRSYFLEHEIFSLSNQRHLNSKHQGTAVTLDNWAAAAMLIAPSLTSTTAWGFGRDPHFNIKIGFCAIQIIKIIGRIVCFLSWLKFESLGVYCLA